MTDGRHEQEVREFEIEFSGSVCLKVRPGQTIDEAVVNLVTSLCDSMAERVALGQPLTTSRVLVTEQGRVVLVSEPRRKRRAKVLSMQPRMVAAGD